MFFVFSEFCSPCTSGLLPWCGASELKINQLCNAVLSQRLSVCLYT